MPRLLESVKGAFDQVVLVDTGSTDRTVEIFEEWAKDEAAKTSVESFTWVDDFAAARTYADSFLSTDWTCWADADDILQGAMNLRAVAAQSPPEAAAYVADYLYAHDEHGNPVCVLKRERLVRRGRGTWVGRVHEAQLVDGQSLMLAPSVAHWVHAKHDYKPTDRNLRILYSWHQAEPDNARVLMYLGTEEAARGEHARAVGFYEQYLQQLTGWDEERAQVHRKYAISLLALDRTQDALETALAALPVVPSWPDSYLTLAQASYAAGEWEKAIEWASEVLRRGQPDSLLILNPLDYTFVPRLVIAGAHGALGHLDEAIAVGDEALKVVPNHQELISQHLQWRRARKVNQTAATFVETARLLITHDEQLKALRLLEDTVPHYAHDHPDVVQMRSLVRERVQPLLIAAAEHYESDTEAGMTEDFVVQLPRALFLAQGLDEQRKEAA